MKKYPVDRKEKNRRHSASLISLGLGALLVVLLLYSKTISESNATYSSIFFVVVLTLRTIFIEVGIRRGDRGSAEQNGDGQARSRYESIDSPDPNH